MNGEKLVAAAYDQHDQSLTEDDFTQAIRWNIIDCNGDLPSFQNTPHCIGPLLSNEFK